MSVGINYRKILSYETLLSTKLQKIFKKQEKVLMENLPALIEKPFKINQSLYRLETIWGNLYKKDNNSDPLQYLRDEMGVGEEIEATQKVVEKVGEKGYKRQWERFKEILINAGFGFSIAEIQNYSKLFGETNLSDYKGAITRTTKEKVLTTIKEGLDNNLTYTELSKEITKVSKELFWANRAKLIAVTELWKAYEYWAHLPIQKMKDAWFVMMKKWETCHDSRVRPAHSAAEAEGRVEDDFVYSHGYAYAWSEPRCRCTMFYERKDLLHLTDL